MRSWGAALRTTVAACVLSATVLLGGGAAHADAPALRFVGAGMYYVATAQPSPGRHNPILTLRLAGSSDAGVAGRFVVDASALAGRATASDVPRNCSQSGMVFTCTEWLDKDVQDYPFALTATAGTPPGFAADIVVRAATTSGPHATAATRVHAVVGEPDLRIPDVPAVTGVRPGSVVRDPVVVVNRGQVPPAQGFVLVGSADLGFDPAGELPANCLSRKGVGAIGDTAYTFWCTFAQPIAPGAAYALDTPVALRTRPELVDADVRYQVWPVGTDLAMTAGAPDDPVGGARIRRNGPVLGLHAVPAAGRIPAGVQAGDFHVVADQQADYQAVGATVHGTVGQTVTVTLKVRNAGPGSMADQPVGGTGMDVTPPPGVTFLSMHQGDPEEVPHPWWCTPKKSGAKVYHCGVGPLVESQLSPGASFTVDVTLRIDRAVAGARGSVRVRRSFGEATHDADTADDIAPILLDVPGAPADSPAAAPPASGTGVSGPVAAGAGTLLALCLSAAATVLVRRRRRAGEPSRYA